MMITSLVLSVTWGTSFTSSLARNWKSANSWTNEERKKRSQQRCNFWTPSTQRRGDLKTVVFSLWKGIRSFPSTLRWSAWTVGLTAEMAAFSYFPGVVWTRPRNVHKRGNYQQTQLLFWRRLLVCNQRKHSYSEEIIQDDIPLAR